MVCVTLAMASLLSSSAHHEGPVVDVCPQRTVIFCRCTWSTRTGCAERWAEVEGERNRRLDLINLVCYVSAAGAWVANSLSLSIGTDTTTLWTRARTKHTHTNALIMTYKAATTVPCKIMASSVTRNKQGKSRKRSPTYWCNLIPNLRALSNSCSCCHQQGEPRAVGRSHKMLQHSNTATPNLSSIDRSNIPADHPTTSSNSAPFPL